MGESLKSEAEEYANGKYPPCFMKINGEFSNDVNFPRRKSAEEHYIAGHQSAERKSAAEIKRLNEVSDMKDAIIEGMRNVVAHARFVDHLHIGLANALAAYDRCKLPAMGPSGMNPKNVDQFKTREMVRELVGALELARDMTLSQHSYTGLDQAISARTQAANILEKYVDEIDQLGREQNGAISKKLMREME